MYYLKRKILLCIKYIAIYIIILKPIYNHYQSEESLILLFLLNLFILI